MGERADIRLSDALLQSFQHLVVFRKPAILLLAAVDQIAICLDIKDATRPFDQLCLDAERALNRVRQTGGSWLVVSHSAVFDRHMHAGASSARELC